MAAYYYAVASLPLLSYNAEMPVERREYLELCRDQLSPADFLRVGAASLGEVEPGPWPTTPVLERWRNWERNLRNELARLRAQKKAEEAAPHLREALTEIGPAEIARAAFGQDSPLAAEELLNRARWAFFDDLESGHFFDVEKLVLYHLRLQLLERRGCFKRERGLESYAKIYQAISETISL